MYGRVSHNYNQMSFCHRQKVIIFWLLLLQILSSPFQTIIKITFISKGKKERTFFFYLFHSGRNVICKLCKVEFLKCFKWFEQNQAKKRINFTKEKNKERQKITILLRVNSIRLDINADWSNPDSKK